MEETSDLESRETRVARRRRVFTLQQANSTLPLVARIVDDIVGLYRKITAVQQELASDSINPADRESIERVAQQQEQRFEQFVDELSDIGCELKDANTGLVDFIGRHEGREICLCWRQGEARIEFWHDLHTGLAGRKPIDTLHESPVAV